MITPAQIRAARALLGWSQEELARRAALVRRTLTYVESGSRPGRPETIETIQATFEREGIVFVSNEEVIGVTVLRGKAALE